MLWVEDLKVSIRSYLENHIDAVIGRENEGEEWRFTGFYGYLETSRRKEG